MTECAEKRAHTEDYSWQTIWRKTANRVDSRPETNPASKTNAIRPVRPAKPARKRALDRTKKKTTKISIVNAAPPSSNEGGEYRSPGAIRDFVFLSDECASLRCSGSLTDDIEGDRYLDFLLVDLHLCS